MDIRTKSLIECWMRMELKRTSVVKEFETLNEMFEFHKGMSNEDRHFCKLYDKEKHRIADGWNIQYDYTDETKWRAW